MNVLITGGAGFIGSYTKELLKAEGFSVYIIDNFVTGNRDHILDDDHLIEGDICDDLVYEKLKQHQFDAIIHLAAQTSVPNSMNNPMYDMKENIEGTMKMLLFAKENGVRKFLFSSSAAVYGNNPKFPLNESDTVMPTSPYGVSKLSAEYYIQMFCEQNNIDATIFRYANVFGPKQSKDGEGGVIKIFIDKINQNEVPQIFGDGNQTRDFIFVEDLTYAHLAVLKGSSRGVFNVSTNTETSVNELIEILSSITNRPLTPTYLPKRDGDIYRSCLDHSKIHSELGWSPKTTVKEGLMKTFSALSNRK